MNCIYMDMNLRKVGFSNLPYLIERNRMHSRVCMRHCEKSIDTEREIDVVSVNKSQATWNKSQFHGRTYAEIF